MEYQRQIPRISEILYVGLCEMIGTPTQVKIRRDVNDAMEMIQKSVEIYGGSIQMNSGSRREGFRLKTSDTDIMIWSTYDIVICDLSQIPPYKPENTLILMECNETPPGFAKLQLLTPTNNPFIKQSCVTVNDHLYISSSLYRKVLQQFIQSFPLHQYATLHGPCTNAFILETEYDFAYCFSCQRWPDPANHWIERCQRERWPCPQVLADIISDGCHIVAIGSGRSTSSQQCETEWRMSFSEAEYKLVNTMNHAQFLCYGILKIFLSEVLNVKLEDPLLCSYFMKTTLFWKIQENAFAIWCPNNIIRFVWACFKYLTQCVYRGEFPNFFIPQNNMFLSKIHGAAQKQLFLQLLTLYNMGFSCLLLSPSLYKILTKAILNPYLEVSIAENNIISEVELDVELFTEIEMSSAPIFLTMVLNDSYLCALSIDNLNIISSCSQNHLVALHTMKNILIERRAFRLDKSKEDNNMHTADNGRLLDMLVSAAESGYISDTLYVAMYLYNKNRYAEALYYVDSTKQKLSQPYVLDLNNANINREIYIETLRGKSLIDKLKMAVPSDIKIDQICCIDEVRLEVHISQENCVPFISVPPLAMTHMLSFLCHHHLADRLRSKHALCDLQNLLHNEEGHLESRDILWQMLGICEQIHGDKERALHAYQQSYVQYPIHQLNFASFTRIRSIISK